MVYLGRNRWTWPQKFSLDCHMRKSLRFDWLPWYPSRRRPLYWRSWRWLYSNVGKLSSRQNGKTRPQWKILDWNGQRLLGLLRLGWRILQYCQRESWESCSKRKQMISLENVLENNHCFVRILYWNVPLYVYQYLVGCCHILIHFSSSWCKHHAWRKSYGFFIKEMVEQTVRFFIGITWNFSNHL